MKTIILVLSTFAFSNAFGWGFFGHGRINEISVYTLPKPLFGFYKSHVAYMHEHAADADKRRYMVAEEACRHYLDGDKYECKIPIDTIPKKYKDACTMYSEDTILAHGIVPWHVQFMLYKLTEAFKEKDSKKILKLSADLGHYVGDLHVPLHATSNYNGQKTGQKGIHALWESRLPELYFDNYDLFTGLAVYLDKPETQIWKAFEESFSLVDSVLKTEKKASLQFTDDQKYSWEIRGNTSIKVYSKEFCLAYHKALGDMVENRLKASIVLFGSLLYTCWVDAGQPNLDNMPVDTNVPVEGPVLPLNGTMIGREEE